MVLYADFDVWCLGICGVVDGEGREGGEKGYEEGEGVVIEVRVSEGRGRGMVFVKGRVWEVGSNFRSGLVKGGWLAWD